LRNFIVLTILLISALIKVSAQDMVYPNMPYAIIKTNQGLISITEFQYGYGTGDINVPYSQSFTGFTALIGYQINRSFIIAAGTGLSKYNGGSLVPLFLDIRYAIKISRLTPYFFGDGGLLLNFTNINEANMFINPGIGIRYSITRKIGINLSTGIMIQTASLNMNAFFNLKTGLAYKF
jgi:hypothetical protein